MTCSGVLHRGTWSAGIGRRLPQAVSAEASPRSKSVKRPMLPRLSRPLSNPRTSSASAVDRTREAQSLNLVSTSGKQPLVEVPYEGVEAAGYQRSHVHVLRGRPSQGAVSRSLRLLSEHAAVHKMDLHLVVTLGPALFAFVTLNATHVYLWYQGLGASLRMTCSSVNVLSSIFRSSGAAARQYCRLNFRDVFTLLPTP